MNASETTMDAPVRGRFSRSQLLFGLLALLTLIGLVDWWYQRHKENRYDRQILLAAQRYGVNPALVKAVVWRESRFNPRVRGRVGEIGLMQIRPLTATEWAQATSKQATFAGNLFEPETNLEIGTWYLGRLLKRYVRTDNPIAYALADYNAGRSNVLRWTKGRGETNCAVFLTKMTFPATRDYVRAIIERSHRYQAGFARKSAAQR
jgi:soluble lytic murein transglycosylase